MKNPTRTRGLTIVEMLAVIGVIAVLLAILLPAISLARRNALWGTSQANLREVGQLLVLYATENREAIVPTAFDYSASVVPGKVRTASPVGANPPVGPLSVGSWADILWTTARFGPVAAGSIDGVAINWDYRYDSPDRVLYQSGWEQKNVFRSAEQLLEPVGADGDEATPFGPGAGPTERGDPGYFGGNPFFDARPPTTARPYSGSFYTTGQIKRPEASMYLADSAIGEVLGLAGGAIDPNNEDLNLVGVEWRYSGENCLMLFLDGHVGTYTRWENLFELEKDLGVRVWNLDRNSFYP